MFPGHPSDAPLAPARSAGRDSEEANGAVVGCAGAPHVAAVPQNGWQRILR